MAKAAVGYSGTTFGTAASAGDVIAPTVTIKVVFTAHANPDGTAVKDTRK